MKKILILTFVSAAFLATSPAYAWNLSQCSAADLAKRADHSARLRSAKPADLAYVPKPFPANAAQVVEDFTYQFRTLRSFQTPEQITAPDKALLALIDGQQLGAEVFRVENWRGSRCLSRRDGDQKFLLRMYDKRTGSEIARAWLEDSGLLGAMSHREAGVAPEWWTIPVQKPEDVARSLSAIVHEPLVDAQYVTTFGQFQCDALLPCVAMRSPSTNTTYVASARGEIVSFPTNAKRFSRARDLEKVDDIARVSRTLPQGRKLMSLGGDDYVVVEKIR